MKTIFGVATAPGKSGVAVVRISGHRALAVLAAFKCKIPDVRQAQLCRLMHNEELVDEVLVIYFKGPHSFTGEDVVELHTHGSRAVIRRVLAILGEIPYLQMAEPGEFSRRAFQNGKMDLTEAEGLADLIDAETINQHKQAMRQMQGKLGEIYDSWRARIIESLAFIEAYIDFPDEDLPPEINKSVSGRVGKLAAEINAHLNDNRRGEKIREGINVVILGTPNTGKSSLLNYLAGRDAAIVSATAGTTRDVIEVQMEIGGYAVTLADTAGLRETTDEIENEGIKLAMKHAADADIKILMFEAGQEPDAKMLAVMDDDALVVINKVDSGNRSAIGGHRISIKSGEGLDGLLQSLGEKISQKFSLSESPIITRARHREALQKALAALENFSLQKPIELAGEDLRYAAVGIGRITGKIEVDDILDVIFSSFCVGK